MKGSKFDNKMSPGGLAFQPLYKQVEEHVTQLIVEQRWKPGEMLPNEFQLAEEFGVSQGTVRKALNTLTQSKVLTRRQGVGTFVSEHTGHQALYRFFPVVEDNQAPQLPEAEIVSFQLQSPSVDVAKQLDLSANEQVVHLSRKRLINDIACLLEDIYLPEKYFPGLHEMAELPHTLYHFYQLNFNLTVHKTTDRIKAILADEKDAEILGINKGDPLLMFTRLTRSLEGKLIEFRVNRCRSDNYHYLVDLD
ncbi:GntR family transcriptional regulator [Planctobacterium marinum]|uniref:GntR family transcriptional regulator n=1 Tax=Planctobacterium marinum TaxID=1631968 RepID=A0AA48KTN0_9ALTE|nr:GntR family transcriptional regulator [Planctobacterium marinum]